MKASLAVVICLLLASLLLRASQGCRGGNAGRQTQASPVPPAVTQDWPPAARLAAGLMVEKYGPPEWIQPGRLEWGTRWPWKRISVDVARPSRPLEQVVDYDVPTSKVGDLRRFPHGLIVYYEEGELAARSDREELNCLTLNLADDIVSGRMTPAQADGFFRSAVRLAAAGKSSAYMDRLIFDASRKVRGPGNPAH